MEATSHKAVLLVDAAYLLKGWKSLKGEMDYNRLVTVLGEILRLPKNLDGTYFWERHYFNSVLILQRWDKIHSTVS